MALIAPREFGKPLIFPVAVATVSSMRPSLVYRLLSDGGYAMATGKGFSTARFRYLQPWIEFGRRSCCTENHSDNPGAGFAAGMTRFTGAR